MITAGHAWADVQHYTPAQTRFWLQAIGAAQIDQHRLDVLGARVANHASSKALQSYLGSDKGPTPRPAARRAEGKDKGTK